MDKTFDLENQKAQLPNAEFTEKLEKVPYETSGLNVDELRDMLIELMHEKELTTDMDKLHLYEQRMQEYMDFGGQMDELVLRMLEMDV
jgi:hypothetical protein